MMCQSHVQLSSSRAGFAWVLIASWLSSGCDQTGDVPAQELRQPPVAVADQQSGTILPELIWQALTSCDVNRSRPAALALLTHSPLVLREIEYRITDDITGAIACCGMTFIFDSTTTPCVIEGIRAACADLAAADRAKLLLRVDDLGVGMQNSGMKLEAGLAGPPDLLFKGLVLRKFALKEIVLDEVPATETAILREDIAARESAIDQASLALRR